MSKVEYKVIKDKRTEDLSNTVEIFLNSGWSLVGGPFVIDQGDAKKFGQAVTKTTIESEPEAPAKSTKGKGEK